MNRATSEPNEFDAIVIGSGMGGLSTASLLASVGKKRVLVLESHFKLGGFLHSFRRNKYVWDPGVHYVGEMQEDSLTRKCMDLVTGKGVQWHKIESPYEKFVFPQESFDVPAGAKQFEAALVERFPDEEKSIRRYFKDVKAVQNWSHRWFFSKQFAKPIASLITIGKRLAMKNTREYVEERFQDPLLRAIVTAQWPDYGTPPGESAFGVHATVQADFFNGGFYPIGGSQQIADSAASVVEGNGGRCKVNHQVTEILIENNRAVGVVAEHKGKSKTYYAPIIISAAGAHSTFTKMVPSGFGEHEKQKLDQISQGTSAVILFMGLKDDPRNHGFTDTNYWLYDRLDFDSAAKRHPDQKYAIDGGFLSFGSLRNPGQDSHTAQIVSFSREQDWSEFLNTAWKKRGDEYEQRKKEYAEDLLTFASRHVGDLRPLIDYMELSSPLSVKTFTGHPGGAIYGQECTEDRLGNQQWQIATSVKNLYLTGSDVGLPGVNGALMAGVMTAGKLLGWFGMVKILQKAFAK